jgi:hypothetical protein
LAPFPIDPRRALGNVDPGIVRKTFFTEAIRRARTLPPAAVAHLAGFATHPRTQALRGLATQAAIPHLRDESSLAALRQGVEANAAAAIWSLATGQPDSARQRLLENATIASWMLRAPSRIAAEVGLITLETAALLPLAELERSLGDEATASSAAAHAREVADRSARFGPGWSIGVLGLASDARSMSEFEATLRDSTIPVGYRLGLVESFRDALCLRPRYLLTGEIHLPRWIGMLKSHPHLAEHTSLRQRVRHCVGIGA